MDQVTFSTHGISLDLQPELWQCSACLSWFTQNLLPESVAVDLYKTGVSGERWSTASFRQNKCREVLEEVDTWFLPGKRVLDIGCSTGGLLDYAKERGCITYGVEVSDACKNVLLEKGHAYISSLDEAEASVFDVVTGFDVIEHLYNLSSFLNRCHTILRSGGVLLILTGDISSISARLCRSNWWYVRFPEHIIFPSRRFLSMVPKEFRLIRWVRTYASVSYRVPLIPCVRGVLGAIRQSRYTGLPSLGSDHALIVLENV